MRRKSSLLVLLVIWTSPVPGEGYVLRPGWTSSLPLSLSVGITHHSSLLSTRSDGSDTLETDEYDSLDDHLHHSEWMKCQLYRNSTATTARPVIQPLAILEEDYPASSADDFLCLDDSCRIIQYDHQESSTPFWLQLDSVLNWKPIILPALAFWLYDPIAQGFAATLDIFGNNLWVAVDGGQYQAQIIAPAINGVVVAAISILFAQLIGLTITTLQRRQASIQLAIQLEATQLRILQSLLNSSPVSEGIRKTRYYLYLYTTRLLAEGNEAVNLQALEGGMDSELNAVLEQLHARHAMSATPALLEQADHACQRLLEERANRITALQSTFPSLHYVLLATLALSILVAFLMETNQDILVFLNAIQLKLLWTILVGTFSALGLVCYDLNHPFRGSYQVSKTVDQLYVIRMGLELELELDKRRLQAAQSMLNNTAIL